MELQPSKQICDGDDVGDDDGDVDRCESLQDPSSFFSLCGGDDGDLHGGDGYGVSTTAGLRRGTCV